MLEAVEQLVSAEPAESFRVPYSGRGSILDVEELEALREVVLSREPLASGAWRGEFEARLREWLGVPHALTVTSGTVALELAIHLLDLQPGDEVVVTPQTYHATIEPLLGHRGVRVRFCDVEPDSLNMDPHVLSRLLTDRTRAVILVHYGGWPADMDRIVELAHAHGAAVIEDCAHALGASLHGRRPGSLADIGCFSFQSSKNITTLGEGGLITMRRADWAHRVDRLRSNKIDGVFAPGEPAEPPAALRWMRFAEAAYGVDCTAVRRAGTNATLSEAACAVGLVQLDRLAALSARRRQIAARLDQVVEGRPGFRAPRPDAGIEHAFHLYTCFAADRERRDLLIRELDRRGVELQLRYFPLHLLPEWRARGHGPGECPVAERLWFTEHVNLPCHPGLSDEQVDYLVDALDAAMRATDPVLTARSC
jgi:perosamine synthetase